MKPFTCEERLRALHEVTNELSRARSVNDLYRSVVELGRNRLGFDRLSIWFVDKDPNFIIGSFGVDEAGRLRDEIGERVPVDDDPAMKELRAKKARSVLHAATVLRDGKGKVVGEGSHMIAAIWTGEQVVGYLSADNLLRKKPATEEDREILELFAASFGHLYSLKEAQYHLIQAAKMEVVGGLASGVAHEVKNSLAIILQGIDYLSNAVSAKDENTLMTLQRMKGAIKRADGIIKELLDFSVSSQLDFTAQDLNRLLDDTLVLVRHDLDKHHIEVLKEYDKGIPTVRVDRNKIEQVFINLFLNAIQHMSDGGHINIRTYAGTTEKEGKAVFVEIEDAGAGIPKNILDRVFDPFFTTRRGAGGTGLGLSIVRNIIDMHNGRIAIGNRKEGQGTKVALMFRA